MEQRSEFRPEAREPKPPERRRALFFTGAVLGSFALVFSLICVTSFVQKSPTVDEPTHLFAGYAYLKWGDFRANPEHPPFAKLWAALPLLALDVKDPVPSSPHWDAIIESSKPLPTLDLAQQMLFVDNQSESLFFAAKTQIVLLGILLGIFVFLWGREIYGAAGGFAALFLFAVDPNILAHSQIIHTDLPFAAFFFIGTYFFRRALERLTWGNLILACVFFALSAVTKYSYPAVAIAWVVLGLLHVFFFEAQRSGPGAAGVASGRWRKAAVLAGIGASAALTAYIFIWAAYGFRFAAVPGGALPLRMDFVLPPENSGLRALASFIAGRRLLPEAWIYGQLYVLQHLARDAFLFGQHSTQGFWSYFPAAFTVKTPLPLLALSSIALAFCVRGRIDRRQALFLLAPVLIYFSSAVWSRTNIGLRHILPIYPFLMVLAGGAAAALWRQGPSMKKAVALLAAWSLWSCLKTYPDELAYFNELVGGPENGYKVLLDSNLDWGQDLKGLKKWMTANRVEKIWLAYFGTAYPEYYGIDSSPVEGSWIPYDPPAMRAVPNSRYMAVSAQLLYGYSKENSLLWLFRSRPPAAVIGGSIFIFNMDEPRS